MHIESIELRDWKCFQHARFDLPQPTADRPVVLIGAQNGGGKTSILEALVFCLYGSEAMDYFRRLSPTSENKREPYRQWVARAVNEAAIVAGRNRALVEIILRDARRRIKIRRTWNVHNDGRWNGEALDVSEAQGNSPIFSSIEVNEQSEETRQEGFRGFVDRVILPVNLAQFFFFDGEEIKRLAERNALDQVRTGVEGLLGVQVLRDLADDLGTVADRVRSEIARAFDPESVRTAEKEIAELEAGMKERQTALDAIEGELPQLEEEVTRLKGEVDRLLAGLPFPIKELAEREQSVRSRLDGSKANIHVTLGQELPLALAHGLVRSLRARLQQEQKRVLWDSQREEWKTRFPRLLSAFLHADTPPLVPPLNSSQGDALKARLEAAWESLFIPPPPDIATTIRHWLLGSDARTEVLQRFSKLHIALDPIRKSINDIDAAAEELRRIQELQQQLQEGTETRRIIDSLSQKREQLARRQTHREQIDREMEALKGQHSAKRALIERAAQSKGARERESRIVERADQVRRMLGEAILELLPLHREQIAERMTYHYGRLTNKPESFGRIDINKDMVARILGRDGKDLTQLDFSAGENEIFALSLVAALKEVSKADLPVVIDTPLARLDKTHRTRVAENYVPGASRQVILLSTDTEFVGPTHEAIRDRVGKYFLVSNPTRKLATVEADRYFERI